jgi:hypothetical protein
LAGADKQRRGARFFYLASGTAKELPRARLVPEGLVGNEALELGTASATIGFFNAIPDETVMLSAQVVMRINVSWLSL